MEMVFEMEMVFQLKLSPAFSLLILGFRVGNCLRDGFRDGDGSVNGDFIFADLMAGASTAL